MNEQLEFPYPINPIVLEPVLTPEAVKRLGLDKMPTLLETLEDYERRNQKNRDRGK